MALLPRFLDWGGDGRIGIDDVAIGLAQSREVNDSDEEREMHEGENKIDDLERMVDEDEDRSW